MRLFITQIPATKEYTLKEEITLDTTKFPLSFPLQEIKKISVVAKAQKFADFLALSLHLKADLVLICSYTLKPFDYVLKTSDEINFSFYDDNEEEDMVPLKGNVIELDEFVYRLLMASLPLKPVAPGATLPKSGEGYEVITDEEYYETKKGNSAFDKLADLDID